MTDTNTTPENGPQTGDQTDDQSNDQASAESSALSDQKRLIGLFSDGKLPTGDNFADLITSMVSQSAFDDHVEKYKEWTARGEIQIGPEKEGWQLLRRSAYELGFQPNVENKVTAEKALIDLFGWTRAYGRIGTVRDTKAFALTEPVMALATLPNVASDGRWKVLMEMPGRVCAFEMVLATAETDKPKQPGLGHFVRWLVGYVAPENAIMRVTVTATGPNREPELSSPSHTTSQAVTESFKYLILALAAAAVLALLGIDFMSRGTESQIIAYLTQQMEAAQSYIASLISPEAMPLAGGLVGGTALAYLARRAIQLFTARRNGLQLRWKKTSGSRLKGNRAWRLEAKGPDMGKGEDAKLYYHITALWG